MESEKLRTTRYARRRISDRHVCFYSRAADRPCRAREWAETGLMHKKRLPGLQVCQFLPGRSAHDQRKRYRASGFARLLCVGESHESGAG
jgi:hypothetical protein